MPHRKHIYRYNPHTLAYEKVIVEVRDKVKKISFTVLFGLLLGVLFLVIGFQVVDSPKEKALKREIRQYKRQLAELNNRVSRDEEVLADLQIRDDNIYRTIFEVEPVPEKLRSSGYGGKERYASMEAIDCSAELIRTTRKVDELSKRLYVQSISLDEIYEMARNKKERLASMPAIMPIAKQQCQIVSGFGMRYHPILHTLRMHTGIDMTARKGTAVYATGDGVVRAAGKGVEGMSGYGLVVEIDHGFGFHTLYAHLASATVRPGQKIKRGEKIGTVGSTGLSQGSHLHYEVLQNGKQVNPVFYFYNDLTPDEYEKVIEAANQENQCLS